MYNRFLVIQQALEDIRSSYIHYLHVMRRLQSRLWLQNQYKLIDSKPNELPIKHFIIYVMDILELYFHIFS